MSNSLLKKCSVGSVNVSRRFLAEQLPLRSAIALMLGAVASMPAHASLSDTLFPYGGVTYSYDDNLLRVPDNANNGNGGLSDTYRSAYAGVRLDRPVGQQVFTADLRVSNVSFNRFDQLDYAGKDFSGGWQWRLGNHLNGSLGAYYSQSLPSFSDFHSAQRNLRISRGWHFDLNYRFHPSWQVRGGTSRANSGYDLQERRFLDRETDTNILGFDYLAASGSTVGMQLSRGKTHYPNPLTFGGVVLNQDFTQDEAKLKVLWKYSPVTQVQFLGGYARRRYDLFEFSNSSGLDGRLIADWSPTATVKLTANLWKEYSPFDGNTITFSHDTGASLSANWAAGARLRFNADGRYVKRDLSGPSGSALPRDAEDSVRRYGVGSSYVFHDNLSLNLSVYREVRSSNSAFSNSYRSNGGSLTANVQF
jgi:exopolysaccharide biosynthesis operon protein EpsL